MTHGGFEFLDIKKVPKVVYPGTVMLIDLAAPRWQIINDTVMGGASNSEVLQAGQGIVFRGQLSLENNGGFASTRCQFTEAFDGVETFRLTLRGDGRHYQFRLRASASPDAAAWRAIFSTDGSLQNIELRLADFEPVIRGRKLPSNGNVNPANICWLGFMLADRRPGPFELQVQSIETHP